METIQFENKLSYLAQDNRILKNILTIVFGSLLLAISAQITIPLQPVPVTLQSFAVLFIGMAVGPNMGSKIILAYLFEGICGVPVFSNFTWGIAKLLGPTGGYLLGFIPAIILTGSLLQTGWVGHRLTIFLAALLGTIVFFIPGYIVLAKFVGFHNAYQLGVMPFYIFETVKLVSLTFITPFFWRKKTQYDRI